MSFFFNGDMVCTLGRYLGIQEEMADTDCMERLVLQSFKGIMCVYVYVYIYIHIRRIPVATFV